MTCIVGLVTKDGFVIGADSMSSNGTYCHYKSNKILIKKNIVMSSSGSARVSDILDHDFTPPKIPAGMRFEKYLVRHFVKELRKRLKSRGSIKKNDSEDRQSAIMIVGLKGSKDMFIIHADFCLTRVRGYDCIGSGGEVAKGSLYSTKKSKMTPRERVMTALQAASATIMSVGPPHIVKEFKKGDK